MLTGFGISLGLQGVGYVLNAFGVSPKITGTLIASGKIIGGIVMAATGAGAGLGLSLIGSGTTDLLSLYTNLSSSAISMISLGSQVLGSFAGGFGGPGGFSWADGLALLKTSIPSLAMDLSATGIEMLGSSLGWDSRLTGLISIPVSAVVGGVARGLTQGDVVVGYRNGDLNSPIYVTPSGGVMDYVNLGLSQSLKSSLSYGVNLGLEAVGVNGQVDNMLLGALSGFATAAGIGGSAGGTSGALDWAKNLLGGIADTAKKFGSAIVKGAQTVISFGQKLIEGVGTVTKVGFQKVAGFFSGLFSRETSENVYKDQAGLLGGTVTQDGGIWTYTAGDSRITYDSITGNVREELISGGRTVQIEGLGEDSSGGIYYQQLTYSQVIQGGGIVREDYEAGKLQNWSLINEGVPLLSVRSQNGEVQFKDNGEIINGDVEIYAPVDIELPDDLSSNQSQQVKVPFKFNFSVLNGILEKLKAEIVPLSVVSTAQAGVVDNQEVYVLVNGILNNQDSSAPGYLENLHRDVIKESDSTEDKISSDDIVFAPTFFTWELLEKLGQAGTIVDIVKTFFTSTTAAGFIADQIQGLVLGVVANLTKDTVGWIREASDPNSHLSLYWDIRRSLDAYLGDADSANRQRAIVGVGYSGGFAPLTEVLNDPTYNAQTLVGLGAATMNLETASKDLLAKLALGAEAVSKGFTDINQVRSILELLATSGGAVGFGLAAVEEIISFIGSPLKTEDDRYNFFIEKVKVFEPLLKMQPIAYTAQNLEMIVNVYGTRDILRDIEIAGQAVGGYRDQMGQYIATTADQPLVKPLINIEIKGASHFDYMERESNGFQLGGVLGAIAQSIFDVFPGRDKTWNETVADFVADLVGHSDNYDELLDFLQSEAARRHGAIINKEGNKWIIKLPGHA